MFFFLNVSLIGVYLSAKMVCITSTFAKYKPASTRVLSDARERTADNGRVSFRQHVGEEVSLKKKLC